VVTECGGNYDAKNYLDPASAMALGGVTNYLSGANNASGATGDSNPDNDPDTPKAMSIQGAVQKDGDGKLWLGGCPSGENCDIVANDKGLALTADTLFATMRKNRYFRDDINSMLDRMSDCLRDQIASGSFALDSNSTGLPPAPANKLAGRLPNNNPCYGDGLDPRGYFSNYKEQLFIAKPIPPALSAFTVTSDGINATCAGVLLFGNQRGIFTSSYGTIKQSRITTSEKNTPSNYLEDIDLTSFTGTGSIFSGRSQFTRPTTPESSYQDIARCIPAGVSFQSVESTTLTALGVNQLSRYDPAARTLTLGSLNVTTTSAISSTNEAALFGCAWQDSHAMGSGVRSYFMFNISNTGAPGPGFTFAAIDGDRNTANVCGAASQHLGFSGNNGSTPFISAPKIGIEFDTQRHFRSQTPFLPDGFDPSLVSSATKLNTLANGRADPSYAGGHIAVVYWGSSTMVSTGYACTVTADCRSPSICDAGVCKLSAEEDDNVHGQLPVLPTERPPPRNPIPPASPSNPPYPPPGVAKLDPNLSGTPTNQNIHVRVEIDRIGYAGRDDNSRLVKVVATNQITLAGLQTIDSIALQAGDTILVTAQTDAKTNGVYLASTGAWIRDASADESIGLPTGTSWFIRDGATNAGSLWRLQSTSTLNLDPLSIQRVRLPVRTAATTAITLSGLQTIAGITLANGDRVLVTAQANAATNGIYIVSNGAWTRAASENMTDGAMWRVNAGSNAGYWHLNSNITPPINIQPVTSNDLYSATLQTQVWMLADSVTTTNQTTHMQTTTRAMAQLDPVVRYGQCSGSCPASNPSGQVCGGVETDGNRYCYTGQKPNLYDRQKTYDEKGSACSSGAACSGRQFCGIDNLCYKPALRTLRLGFTDSQNNRDQVISISNFSKTWLP
jgi:hypothetical protein